VAVAQRGWATAGDVVNTWDVDKLLEFVGGGAEEPRSRGAEGDGR
jgi:hypothetical protein